MYLSGTAMSNTALPIRTGSAYPRPAFPRPDAGSVGGVQLS